MSYVNYQNQSPYYYDNGQANPRSRFNQNPKSTTPRDSRIIADKIEKRKLLADEIVRQEVLNESDAARYYKSLNAFKPVYVYADFSHVNVESSAEGKYIFRIDRSAHRSNADIGVVTSALIKLQAGKLKMPTYLAQQGYDLSEIIIEFSNITAMINNGRMGYHFKMYPVDAASLNDPRKITYEPEIAKYEFILPQQVDYYEMVLRDKAGPITIPQPTLRGTITTGAVTTITTAAHGLQTGFAIYFDTLSVPSQLQRIYPITVVDANTFTIAVDTSLIGYINGNIYTYIVDDFNFEFNIKALNINWDNEHTFSGRK